MLSLNRDATNSNKRQCVLLFPGQGLRPCVSWLQSYCNSSLIKPIWQSASDIAGFDVKGLCLKGTKAKLIQTRYQQVIATALNLAALYLLRDTDPLQEIGVAGHSSGEYSALFAADVIGLEDVFHIINFRALLMQELANKLSGTMLAVKNCPLATLKKVINKVHSCGVINLCCDNSASHQVFGGQEQATYAVAEQLSSMNFPLSTLFVNGAWHTALMAEGKERLRQYLASFRFNSPNKPLVMNVSAQFTTDVKMIKENLVEHLVNTVRWRESMSLWTDNHYSEFIEVSDSAPLYALIKSTANLKHINISHCYQHIKSPL